MMLSADVLVSRGYLLVSRTIAARDIHVASARETSENIYTLPRSLENRVFLLSGFELRPHSTAAGRDP